MATLFPAPHEAPRESAEFSQPRTLQEFWQLFQGDVLLAGDAVRFTAKGRNKLREWFEPWGLNLDTVRSRADLEAMFALWCSLSEDEDRSNLELRYWQTRSRTERKELEELLGYVPPKPVNLDEVDRDPSLLDTARKVVAEDLTRLADKLRR